MSQTDFLKTYPYLIRGLDEFSRTLSNEKLEKKTSFDTEGSFSP